MDILKRRYRNIAREFRIYSQAEADEVGIDYVPWKESKEGDWVLSDDGYVGECMDIAGPYSSNGISKRYFSFSFGKAWEGGKLTYLDRKLTGSYYTTSGKHWLPREMSTWRCKNFIDAYVAMFMVGKIDWAKLGEIYRPDQYTPTKAVKYIFKQEDIKRMIDDRLQKEFSERGITEGDVIDRYLTIYKKADSKENPDLRIMKSVTDEFRDLLDMNPKPETKGYAYPGEEIPADWDKMEADADKAELENKQRQLEK